jgi:hypothetical protein
LAAASPAPGESFVEYLRVPQKASIKHRGSQHGGSGIKAVLYTVVLVIAIFVAFKILPAYVSEYQLNDKMEEQARFAVVNRYSEDQIRDIIYKEVQDLDIPAKREDIKISATREVVKITVVYTVPVDLLVYSTELHFSPSSENKSIM